MAARWENSRSSGLTRRSDLERFWARVDVGDCWQWTGTLNSDGYGSISISDGGRARVLRVHRVVWELLVGEIPAGLEMDHLCRNRACLNPDHLEPVTTRENQRRSPIPCSRRAKGGPRKTHCKWGHEFSYIRKDGAQGCGECNRRKSKAHSDRQRGRAS